MRSAPSPRVHLLVCTNRREASPLGPGCGARGDAVYDAMKREVAARGCVADVWVTRTHCLGVCPASGATVARYPGPNPIRAEVEPSDAAALIDEPAFDPVSAFERDLADLEELQRDKVLALARRLRPGLTLEDVQNPHDFPELDDPDWHYADGVLAGVQSARTALRARRGS